MKEVLSHSSCAGDGNPQRAFKGDELLIQSTCCGTTRENHNILTQTPALLAFRFLCFASIEPRANPFRHVAARLPHQITVAKVD
jgi:hypothetical protein